MSKFRTVQKLGITLILSLLTACGTSVNKDTSSSAANKAAEKLPQEKTAGGGGGKETNDFIERLPPASVQQISLATAEQTQNEPAAAVERKIIRNADLQLETDAPQEAQTRIAAIVDSKGGFVIESTQSSSAAATREAVTMTVRVPAAKFEESLNEIRLTASRVIVETVKGEDVTEEFIDIEARLKTQKALEAQFLEIMKQAKSVEDALDVQSKLADVRGEIEKAEGRRKFLENQTTFSTIKISLQVPAAISGNSDGFFYRLKQSVGGGFDFAVDFVLGLVTFLIGVLPFVLLIVLPICLVVKYLWRKRRKRKTADEIAREEIKIEQ